jgi:hypothetical protein
MNKLSQTLTFNGIVKSLPSLKDQLNPKNFPKYTIPQTYYESYFNILSVKKQPLVQGTLKAAKEGKIKLLNLSDPIDYSDKKSILQDAISTVVLPVGGEKKVEVYVNAAKKTGYVRNVDKEAIGLRTNEVALYSYLQTGYISYILATKDTEVTNNIKLHTILAEFYSYLMGKVLDKCYPVTGDSDSSTRLSFILAMYYFQVMCGYDLEKSIKLALTVKSVDPVLIGNSSRAFSAGKLAMKDFNDLLDVFKFEFPFVRQSEVTLRGVISATMAMYGASAMFVPEHFQSFLNMLECVANHSNMFKDQAVSFAVPTTLMKNVDKILLLISGEV